MWQDWKASWRQWDPVTVIAQNTPRVAYQRDRGCEGPGRRANLRPYNTGAHYPPLGRPSRTAQAGADLSQYIRDSAHGGLAASPLRKSTKPTQSKRTEIGRASCRERVCQYV